MVRENFNQNCEIRISSHQINPVGEYSNYGEYEGATFQLGDFGDLNTASKGYKNSKSVPGGVMIFETFEKFFKVHINFCESFQKLG